MDGVVLKAKDSEASEMDRLEQYQKLVFIQRKWCSLYSEIGSESPTSRELKWLIQTSTTIRPIESNDQQKVFGMNEKV